MNARRVYWRLREWVTTRPVYCRLVRGRLIRDYFARHPIRKLQIGCGPRLHPDWLNADLEPRSSRCIYLDATEPFPFEDESFDFVFTEHMIEHASYEQGLRLLAESFRVLKPGGKLRVVTPDLEALVSLLREPLTDIQRHYVRWLVEAQTHRPAAYHPAVAINTAVRAWGHQFIYDETTLRAAMERAGFDDIRRYSPEETQEEHFRGVEAHGLAIQDPELARYEAFALEGRRPAGPEAALHWRPAARLAPEEEPRAAAGRWTETAPS